MESLKEDMMITKNRNPTSRHTSKCTNAGDSAVQSVAMLRDVIAGATYEDVASRFYKTRTAVERRVKSAALRLSQSVGIQGLGAEGTAIVSRLRQHQTAILSALDDFDPQSPVAPLEARILSSEEVKQGALRIKGRSLQPLHDVALFYTLFATGARPLELARLQVRDYLDAQGRIRTESQLRAEVTICGKARPLHFSSSRLNDALDSYLQERVTNKLGVHASSSYRGLDPDSRLFLSRTGIGFQIISCGKEGQRRFLCRPILETFRKLFRYAEIQGVSALSARRTVVSRLYERGADEDQVGLLLGISERSAVRELLLRRRPSIASLVQELV